MKLTTVQLDTLRWYAGDPGRFAVFGSAATCAALVRRGLLEAAKGPDTGRTFYRVTTAGMEASGVLQ